MFFSIITVSYNSSSTIEDTLKSVFCQTVSSEVENIVIDGGSTDGTVELIKKYGDKVSKWISERDNGIYDAMNKGIEMATGDVIGFLNSDDAYADPDTLTSVMDTFKSGCDCCYSDLVYVSQNLSKIIRYWKSGKYSDGKFYEGWHPPHPTFFARREIFEKYGVFDASYKIAADYEIMLRFLVRHKISVSYLPEVTVKMRVGGESNRSLKNIIKANAEVKRAWLDNGLKPPPFIYLRKPLSKLKQIMTAGSYNLGENG